MLMHKKNMYDPNIQNLVENGPVVTEKSKSNFHM